jgi:GDP-4-dehydro-6-deoxy-D-mannose reductase
VLVTGVSGFVGAHLTRALVERGAAVEGTGADDAPPTPNDLQHYEPHFDVREAERVRTHFEARRPDVVVHLAAQSSAGESFKAPTETFAINVLGTWNVIEAIRSAVPEARALLVGTGEVYGPQAEGTRAGEDAPFRPVSPYALSKAAADAMGALAHKSFGLDTIRTRSFGHLGPGQTTRFFLPSFAKQIAEIEAGRREPRLEVGNLDVVRDLCDVRDVVAAYVALIERGRAGGVYNVCRGEGVSLADLTRDLIARARVPISIETNPALVRPADVPYLVGDPGLLQRELDWRPGISLDRTLNDVLDEWRATISSS